MKRMKIIAAAFLVAFVASNWDLNAQRGMRGVMGDSLRMKRPDTAYMNPFGRLPMQDRYRMYGMRDMRDLRDFRRSRGFSYYNYRDNRPDYRRPGPVARGFYRIPPVPLHRRPDSTFMDRMRRPDMDRYGYWPGRIPDLTDAQQDKLKDLMERNQSEMRKFRDEAASSMRKMREQHREKMLEILTPEQKKWLESGIPGTPTR